MVVVPVCFPFIFSFPSIILASTISVFATTTVIAPLLIFSFISTLFVPLYSTVPDVEFNSIFPSAFVIVTVLLPVIVLYPTLVI